MFYEQTHLKTYLIIEKITFPVLNTFNHSKITFPVLPNSYKYKYLSFGFMTVYDLLNILSKMLYTIYCHASKPILDEVNGSYCISLVLFGFLHDVDDGQMYNLLNVGGVRKKGNI